MDNISAPLGGDVLKLFLFPNKTIIKRYNAC